MPWDDNPDYYDLLQLNSGKQFTAQSALTASIMNIIVQDLQFLKEAI